MTVPEFLERLEGVRQNGGSWTAKCPAHDDRKPSLTVTEGSDGRVLINCFAGCAPVAVLEALGLRMRDLFPRRNGQAGTTPKAESASDRKAESPPAGLVLTQYAEAKRLPVDFLRGLGLSDVSYQGAPAVRIPFMDQSGTEAAVLFRLALEGENRFRWRSGSKPSPYGLGRLDRAKAAEQIALVEGPSDAQTLWLYDVPALGLPSARWDEAWASYLEDIPVIYVLVEPGQSGEAVTKGIATSAIRDRVRLVDLGQAKDPSGLYLEDPEAFPARWQAALDAAVPWTDQAQAEIETRTREAWAQCEALAKEPRILDKVAATVEALGVAGEARAAKLIYLMVTSRFEERPVSGVVKGPSSAGKSYVTQKVLDLCPPSAYYALSSMSERALAYSDEPLAQRFLVLYEAAGIQGDFANYLVRSLLSEGCVRYETVEKTPEGLRARLIARKGPTGLLLTTTRLTLHAENETRLFSVPVTDTPEQTKAVLRRLAGNRTALPGVDLAPWRALQTWLEGAEHRATVPYAEALAGAIPPVAVRLRRDFGAILSLIRAHAVLHQANRERDPAGAIVASLEDYAVVRDLVADLVAEGAEATVSETIRETVQAVAALRPDAEKGVTVTAVAKRLGLDKPPTLRRVKGAIERGYLKNLEDRKGRPARLVLGDPLPEDVPILPLADDPRLAGAAGEGGAADEREAEAVPDDVLLGLASPDVEPPWPGEDEPPWNR